MCEGASKQTPDPKILPRWDGAPRDPPQTKTFGDKYRLAFIQ